MEQDTPGAGTAPNTGPPTDHRTLDAPLAEAWIRALAAAVDTHRQELTDLDSAIGDGDHGSNLHRGFTAVLAVLDTLEPADAGAVLGRTGSTLISKVGGASGPLYGSAFRAMGAALPPSPATPAEFAGALAAGLAAVRQLGGAGPGDKTLVDAYTPALAAFEQAVAAGGDLAGAASAAAEAAEQGMRATTALQARKGRASYLGPRSIGHQDPGATSTALLFRTLADVTG
ncbi:dihydroxyacetone kinase subunit DhaL [Kitasatospora sp. NBC_00240]|uniref:dihydroxyacetone kinase subunit DhaL n=1 Tax=Kitasatospora sp. NBC_00240 TaxID=2903567 RepID=UPI00224D4B0F|nr:dihydroxyacetone kinase subunit DhaL [Kitasatospora sp. NBC_00240]MCX5210453.1 dihydroxyacetone kinase subunit DhaL [Kitasatospora sp. NBC_00240]